MTGRASVTAVRGMSGDATAFQAHEWRVLRMLVLIALRSALPRLGL